MNTIEEASDEASSILSPTGAMRISFGGNGTFMAPLNLSFRNELPSQLNATEIKNVRASFMSQSGSFLEEVGK